MATTMLPLDAVSGTPSYTAQATRQAFSVLAGPAPAGRPLGAISGVRLGTPSSTVTLSGGGSTTWNVAAHSGILDTQTAAAAGPYFYATDGSDTGSITAANATNPRIDILYVKVNDNVQDGSGLLSGQVLYLAGTAAASPVQPATPARGLAIARINVPTSGGGSPTITWVAPTAAGGLLTQSGTVANSGGGSTAVGVLAISPSVLFPIAYSTAPAVTASITGLGTSTGGRLVVQNLNVTTTGATFNVYNMGTATQGAFTGLNISWTAVGTL